MRRRNRKNRRRGKVVIPDLLSSIRDRAGHFGSSHRRWVIVGIKIALAALVIYAFATGPAGFLRLFGLYREGQKLHAEDRRLTAEIVQLENIRRYLELDTTYIEKVAREDYGFSRPEEIIYLEPQAGED